MTKPYNKNRIDKTDENMTPIFPDQMSNMLYPESGFFINEMNNLVFGLCQV